MEKRSMKKLLVVSVMILSALAGSIKSFAQCGIDIYIANDQSGSIDATEDRQGKTFIKNLAQSLSLGNANSQSRIALANWSSTNTWVKFNFPSAGQNYTTLQSDVLSYPLSPFNAGNTDPYDALRRTYQQINETPVTGRTVPKMIVLMTDAYCYQIQPNIVQLATQIKQSGVYVMVLAIDAAASCTILQGTNVASPGMYFNSAAYSNLASNAQSYIRPSLERERPV